MMGFREHPSEELLLRSIDGELSGAALTGIERHLDTCRECRSRQQKLARTAGALETYSDALTDARIGGRQRQELLAALSAPAEPAPRWRLTTAEAVLALSAAVFLVFGVFAVLQRHQPREAPDPSAVAAEAGPWGNGFIQLPYSDENLSPEGAVVLQVELPRSALLLAGIPSTAAPANGRVKAEVVVGADGLARAIRFLN